MERYPHADDYDASFRPQNAYQQPPQYYSSARGEGNYQVQSAASYMPYAGRIDSPSPPPHGTAYNPSYSSQSPQFHSSHQAQPTLPNLIDNSPRRPDPAPTLPNLMDRSPRRQPPPPLHRDPHAVQAPIPPPHSQAHHVSRAPAAAAGAAGGAALGAGFGRTSPYHEPSNPFDEHSQLSPMAPAHSGYPDYPPAQHQTPYLTPAQNPFSSRPSSYNSLEATNTAYDNYTSRPGMNERPTSFTNAYPPNWRNQSEADLANFDPRQIAEDDDDAAHQNIPAKTRAAATVSGAFSGTRDVSGNYSSVPGGGAEKAASIKDKRKGRRRFMWTVVVLIVTIIILAIVGGVVGAVLSSRKNNSGSSRSSSSSATDNGPDLNANSPQIRSLMNNPNLHKVFPGMDYTPLNSQYPDCVANPPSQNNITMDVAVMSQLTPVIRLYGTDCNQTEMVLHALDALNLKNDMKVWMGVWLDNNKTTGDRQMAQMWDILDKSGPDPFAGLIIGNEILFREQMTEQQMIDTITSIRSNLTSKNIDLPVATSDLGTKWDATLAKAVDVVMSNIHPFFGGVPSDEAAAWTWSYWNNNVAPTSAGLPGVKQTIAETGWPSTGGQYCTDSQGSNTTCTSPTQGAVATVDDMNRFMDDWVCQSLANGTSYFWFEAFDEPWKVIFNTATEQWENEWGLMDVERNLKKGVKIPDCGGQQAKLP